MLGSALKNSWMTLGTSGENDVSHVVEMHLCDVNHPRIHDFVRFNSKGSIPTSSHALIVQM